MQLHSLIVFFYRSVVCCAFVDGEAKQATLRKRFMQLSTRPKSDSTMLEHRFIKLSFSASSSSSLSLFLSSCFIGWPQKVSMGKQIVSVLVENDFFLPKLKVQWPKAIIKFLLIYLADCLFSVLFASSSEKNGLL